MSETKLAPAPWHKPPRVKKPKPFKEQNKVDKNFEAWAAKNNVNLKEIPLMQKRKKT